MLSPQTAPISQMRQSFQAETSASRISGEALLAVFWEEVLIHFIANPLEAVPCPSRVPTTCGKSLWGMSYRAWERCSRTWRPIFAANGVVSLWRSLLRRPSGLTGKTNWCWWTLLASSWLGEKKVVLSLDILQLCRRAGGGCLPNIFRVIDPLEKAGSHVGGPHYDVPGCWCPDKLASWVGADLCSASVKSGERTRGPTWRVSAACNAGHLHEWREGCSVRAGRLKYLEVVFDRRLTRRDVKYWTVMGRASPKKNVEHILSHVDCHWLVKFSRWNLGGARPCGATSMLQCKSSLRSWRTSSQVKLVGCARRMCSHDANLTRVSQLLVSWEWWAPWKNTDIRRCCDPGPALVETVVFASCTHKTTPCSPLRRRARGLQEWMGRTRRYPGCCVIWFSYQPRPAWDSHDALCGDGCSWISHEACVNQGMCRNSQPRRRLKFSTSVYGKRFSSKGWRHWRNVAKLFLDFLCWKDRLRRWSHGSKLCLPPLCSWVMLALPSELLTRRTHRHMSSWKDNAVSSRCCVVSVTMIASWTSFINVKR